MSIAQNNTEKNEEKLSFHRQKKIFICLIIPLYILLATACKKHHDPIYKKADKVLVIKSKRTMQLLKDGVVLRTYDISLGANPVGHKQQEGDERTPEGIYRLDWRNARSSCYKSLHISYPNEKDIEQARQQGVSTGGMVMIHGLHSSVWWLGNWHTLHNWTDGCVA